MKIEYSDLSKDGLFLRPSLAGSTAGASGPDGGAAHAFLDLDRDAPEIVGFVPNLSEFATGGDYNVGAFEIKGQDCDDVCVPANLAMLLPTTQLIVEDLYSHAGPEAAAQCQISLQFFRANYESGQHLLFDRIHRHAAEGKMVIYVVTAIDANGRGDPEALGTEFYAPWIMGKRVNRAERAASPADFRAQFDGRGIVAAPGGAIIRFSETTLHAAPDITHALVMGDDWLTRFGDRRVRRSLVNIIASYKQDDGTIYGRTRPPNHHRPSPVEAVTESRADYGSASAISSD